MSTTRGRFRVLANPRDEGVWTFVSLPDDPTEPTEEAYELVDVAHTGHGDLDETVSGLRPGYVVEAELSWATEDPTVESLAVEKRTLYASADGVTNLFEAAQDAWENARAQGEAMASQVTRDTDGAVNGVLYVFGETQGAGDLYDEFVSGRRPIEPLVARVNENEEPGDREVFVLRPAGGEFVVIYIALAKDGLLADTVRDTYDLPRPDEPLA
ncbi:DUF6663 family protein [Haloarchaeobius sp. HME9146]|uniref:DUF6663 family protein n=1 Tax=Haloarchaeobius sp. HME9146 TaxID=2978732 RepID=UPI0021C11831|nr:DUF6663 family protein [Haloarchaeobius sp. HME9146]MCT9096992.1 hypothetical protein [Haloarchaeobius sp. HME9146]